MILDYKYKKGFTLVETLVAVTVLILSIVGPMSIAANSLFSAYYSRDKITAYYLAQEGIEGVRWMRDSLYIQDYDDIDLINSPLSWLGGESNQSKLSKCFSKTYFDDHNPQITSFPTASGAYGKGCTIDLNENYNNIFEACPASGCPPLRLNNTSKIYNYSPPDPITKYTRVITITPVNNQTAGDYKEAIVKSEITWTNGVAPKSFAIYDRLYNWQRQ